MSILSKKKLLYLLLAFIATSAAFRYVHANDEAVAYYHTISASGDLAVGCLVAYACFYLKPFIIKLENLSSFYRILFYAAAFTIVVFFDKLVSAQLYTMLYRMVLACFYAFIILDHIYIRTAGRAAQKKYVTAWGKYTYGMYLLHSIPLVILDSIFFRLGYDVVDPWINLMLGSVALLLTLLISYMSFELVEKHFIKLKALLATSCISRN